MTDEEWRDKWYEHTYEKVIDNWELTVFYLQDALQTQVANMCVGDIIQDLLDDEVITEEEANDE